MSRFKWYRKWKGGVWQLWLMEGRGEQWFNDADTITRPSALCRGTPVIERY